MGAGVTKEELNYLMVTICLCREYCETNLNGGSLHIVLDDANVNDSHIQYCIDEAKKLQDIPALAIADRLMGMADEMRKKVVMFRKPFDLTVLKQKWGLK